MRESTLWKWLESNRPPWLEIERFECSTPSGTGDCYVMDTRTQPAVTGWLELKFCAEDDHDYIKGRIPKLRPLQPLFLRRMAARGIPSGILLRAGSRFHLWRSNGTHEWSQLVRSEHAVPCATRTWTDFPKVESIWFELTALTL